MSTVIITHQFLDDNRTASGAWTRAQFEAIGVAWPPRSGWRQQIVGTEISYAQAEKFIAGSEVFSERTLKKRAKQERREAGEGKVNEAIRRAKACVSACEGIPTDFLESPMARGVLVEAFEIYTTRRDA